MQRFLSNYGGANGAINGNESVVSNDFNWNELSIGNNDTLAENNFFGKSFIKILFTRKICEFETKPTALQQCRFLTSIFDYSFFVQDENTPSTNERPEFKKTTFFMTLMVPMKVKKMTRRAWTKNFISVNHSSTYKMEEFH